jgi:hypothetical protein
MSTEKELQPDRDALGEALPDALRRAADPGEAAALLLALAADGPQPPAALGQRLRERAAASRAASATMTTRRKPWSGTSAILADGVLAWELHGGSRLLELQSGSRWTLPAAPQELLLLDGALEVDGAALRGLQHRVLEGGQTLQAGTRCRLYLRSHAQGPFQTATPSDAVPHWQPLRDGVEICPLHAEGAAISLLARFAAGAAVPAHAHGIAEECLMVEGELFLGDVLLPEGGFQAAPAGTDHGELFADAPCLLFFHGAIDAAAIDNAHRAQLGWPAL